jgi:hypothetical protein
MSEAQACREVDYRIYAEEKGVCSRTILYMLQRGELEGRRLGRKVFVVAKPLPPYMPSYRQRKESPPAA